MLNISAVLIDILTNGPNATLDSLVVGVLSCLKRIVPEQPELKLMRIGTAADEAGWRAIEVGHLYYLSTRVRPEVSPDPLPPLDWKFFVLRSKKTNFVEILELSAASFYNISRCLASCPSHADACILLSIRLL